MSDEKEKYLEDILNCIKLIETFLKETTDFGAATVFTDKRINPHTVVTCTITR